MAHFIVKIKDKYMVHSSICDAPITNGMDRDELERWCRDEYGRSGMVDFEQRMARVEEKGTSSFADSSVEDTLCCNRAGPNEEFLTLDEIYQRYCTTGEQTP